MTLPDMPPHELRAVAQVLANALEDVLRMKLKQSATVAMIDVAMLVNDARCAAHREPQLPLRLVVG
jgi:hypothetical protein